MVFITCVTRHRVPYLKSGTDIDLFIATSTRVQQTNPFDFIAYVVLPDHFHCLMKVDHPSGDFSKVLHSIKRNFTRNYKRVHDIQGPLSIWQRGFWDHVIRNEQDFENHLDYIHWNPIKHGYVNKPEDWPYSSFRDWVDLCVYGTEWGWIDEPKNIRSLNFE